MSTMSNNIETPMVNKTNQTIKELLETLLKKSQEELEENNRGSKFLFDCVDLFYYNPDKTSLNSGGSCIDSPKWLRNKKAIINLKTNDDKCFKYPVTGALDYQNIKNNPERIPKIKSSIDQYNWEEIDFTSHKKVWIK